MVETQNFDPSQQNHGKNHIPREKTRRVTPPPLPVVEKRHATPPPLPAVEKRQTTPPPLPAVDIGGMRVVNPRALKELDIRESEKIEVMKEAQVAQLNSEERKIANKAGDPSEYIDLDFAEIDAAHKKGIDITTKKDQESDKQIIYTLETDNSFISVGISKGEKRIKQQKKDKKLINDPYCRPTEDSAFLNKDGLAGVADGMGGHSSGAIASREALYYTAKSYPIEKIKVDKLTDEELLQQKINLTESQLLSLNPTRDPRYEENQTEMERVQNLEHTINESDVLAKEAITLYNSITEADSQIEKGTTTISTGKIISLPDGRQMAVFAQVGDSGVYKINKKGEVEDLLPEHSTKDFLIKTGQLSEEDAKNPNFEIKEYTVFIPPNTEPHVKKGPFKVARLDEQATSGLGKKNPRPLIGFCPMEPGENLLFLTDGAKDVEKLKEVINAIISTSENTGDAVKKLIDYTKKLDEETIKKFDDIAFALLKCKATKQRPAERKGLLNKLFGR